MNRMMVLKFLIVTIAAVAVTAPAVILRPTSTSANAGPHGNYDLNTSACAACHRAHTAVGEELLKEESVYALCTSCHGVDSYADTDVVHGTYDGGDPLNGGGFEQYMGEAVSSSHTVDGLPVNGTPSAGQGTAWGSQNGDGSTIPTPTGTPGTPIPDAADIGVGVTGVLECTSCHNPHGSTNYRILRDSKNGYPTNPLAHRWVPYDEDLLGWVDKQVVGVADFQTDYTFTYADDCGVGTKCRQDFTSGIQSSGTPLPDVTKGMNAFCATCHKSYLTKSGSAGFPSDNGTPQPDNRYPYTGTQDALDGHDDVARYRHAVARSYTGSPKQPLRFAALGSDATPVPTYSGFGCLTCHYAHGTNAEASGYAAGVDPTNDSALLFYDNRGVCISCHQGDQLSAGAAATATAYAPTATPVPPTATPTNTPGP